jgi:hypothetical protein
MPKIKWDEDEELNAGWIEDDESEIDQLDVQDYGHILATVLREGPGMERRQTLFGDATHGKGLLDLK